MVIEQSKSTRPADAIVTIQSTCPDSNSSGIIRTNKGSGHMWNIIDVVRYEQFMNETMSNKGANLESEQDATHKE